MHFQNKILSILLLIVVLGSVLRIANITKNPTWWDEHANVFTASGILVDDNDPVTSLRLGGVSSDKKILISENQTTTSREILSKCMYKHIFQASIYWDLGNGLKFTIPLHFWLNVFGCSDAAIRSLSCLFGILVIPAGYAVTKKISGSGISGLITAALLASNSLLIEYSVEARSYSLAILLSLLSTYVFLKITNEVSIRYNLLIVYTALLSALAFAHYLAVPVLIIAHLTGAIFSKNRKNSLFNWLIGVAFMGLSVIYWIKIGGASKGLEGMRHMDGYWLENALAGTYSYVGIFHWKDALRMLVERSVWFVCPLFQFWPPAGILNLLLLTLLLVAIIYTLIQILKIKKVHVSGLIICIVLSFGMIYNFFLSYRSGHTLPFINRYNIFYIPYQVMLFSIVTVGVRSITQKTIRNIALFILIIGFCKITISNIKYASHLKPKASFSFDQFLKQKNIKSGQILLCDSRDSALITALKSPREILLNIKLDHTLKEKVYLSNAIDDK